MDARPARKAAAEHAQRNPFRNKLERASDDRTQASIVVRPIRTRRSWKPQPIASVISTMIEHSDIQNRLRTAEKANAGRVPLACLREPMLQRRAKIWPYMASQNRARVGSVPGTKSHGRPWMTDASIIGTRTRPQEPCQRSNLLHTLHFLLVYRRAFADFEAQALVERERVAWVECVYT